MEEMVGKWWHRWVTGAAEVRFPEAAVTLDAVRPAVGVMFRALGGEGGLRIEAASASAYQARRSWMQRVAGSGEKVELGWRDGETLRLPATLELFPDAALNRDLYLWLAALAALSPELPTGGWLAANQAATARVLKRLPGLGQRYRRLVQAHLATRPDPARLPAEEAGAERAVRRALAEPGSVPALPVAPRPPHPVPLWLHPDPPLLTRGSDNADSDGPDERSGNAKEAKDKRRRRAERVDMPDGKDGLVAVRMEAIFSWAEFVKVDRSTEEDEDENAERAADDLDVLSVARDGKSIGHRIRFDLDLPSAEHDDFPLAGPLTLPEWDYRKQALLPRHCQLHPLVARNAEPCDLPQHLRRPARRVRAQFETLAQSRQWLRGQPEGSEVDLDAYMQFTADRRAGLVEGDAGLYRSLSVRQRDLACLLLADLSLSTDAAVNDHARVIDVIRDSLFLFAEALGSAGDRFGMYGFSSKKRQHVRLHAIKGFSEAYSPAVRGRIAAVRPGYYTRMGAAIRHSADLLSTQAAARRLLLVLTDGKPNDLDRYEGRYGIEDTREALREARRRGLDPFCVTIDQQGASYLPHLFGSDGFVVIRRPEELPLRLPQLYAKLTGSRV